MITKIELTEDLLKLIHGFDILELKEGKQYGVDIDHMYGGTYLYEQMAILLGWEDKEVPETKEDPDGVKFEKGTMEKLVEYDDFMTKHLLDIEQIIHQYCVEGVKPGFYKSREGIGLWKYAKEDIPFDKMSFPHSISI